MQDYPAERDFSTSVAATAGTPSCCWSTGYSMTAVDVSAAAIEKLAAQAREPGQRLHTAVEDVRELTLRGPFHLVIAHGLLHLLPRPDWSDLIGRMRASTTPLGYNVVAVFTDTLPPPRPSAIHAWPVPGGRARGLLSRLEDRGVSVDVLDASTGESGIAIP